MSAKKMTTENKLLYGGVALAGVAGIIALVSNSGNGKKLGTETFPVPETTPTPTPTPTQNNTHSIPAPVPALNKNLVLAQGSRGQEVVQLQKLLGITADGVFGPNTEAALKAKKGVIKITLNQFATAANVNNNSYPLNTKVFSNTKAGAKLYGNRTLPNGLNESTGVIEDTFEYGKEIGVIKGASQNAIWYRVLVSYFLGDYYRWVLASEVKKY